MTESHFNRGSVITLGASILLLVMVFAVNAYRYTLPTDGWEMEDFEAGLSANLLQLPSDLQVGDVPVTIGDVPMAVLANQSLGYAAPLPPNWRPGQTVPYTVKRGERTLTVPVPIGNWTPTALWNGIIYDWPDYLIALLYFLIGAFVFALRPGNLAAHALFFLGSVRLTMVLILSVPLGIGDSGNAFAITAVALLGFYSWGILMFPTFLLLSLVFPKPKRPFRTHPVLTLAFLYLLEPVLLLAFGGISAEMGPTIGFGLVAVFGLLTVLSILHTILTARGDAVARAQILWVGLAIALVTGFQFVVNFIGFNMGSGTLVLSPPEWLVLLNSVIYLVVPAAFAVAILRFRLFDIDILIRRTLTYALVTAVLAVVFFGSVIVLQQLFSQLTGAGQNELVTVLSTLAIAALFVPLRNRVQNAIDRRFNRKRYDAQQVLNDFAQAVRDETDLEKLTARLMQVVDETMQPKSVSLWLKKDSRAHTGPGAGVPSSVRFDSPNQ